MHTLVLFHPGNPNLFELYGLLLAILSSAYILNTLYEWLKKKPWKKNETHVIDPENHTPHNPAV